MIGVGVGAAIVVAGHYILKKQVPAYAVPGTYQWQKAIGAASVPALLMYYLGEMYEKDCRARNHGLSPPRISQTPQRHGADL